MVYKSFAAGLYIRLVFLLIIMAVLTFVMVVKAWYFSGTILALVFIGQSIDLLRFVSRTNRSLAGFLNLTRSGDFVFQYNSSKKGSGFDELYNSFNQLAQSLKEARITKEAQFEFFNEMVRRLQIGIIARDEDGQILLMNPAAEGLLGIPSEREWRRLERRSPVFTEVLNSLKTGEKLVFKIDKGERELVISRKSFKIAGQHFDLFSFQNIRQELESRELESWHKLIRVLTHEIMNSVSPIVSLTETMELLLKNTNEKGDKVSMRREVYEDTKLSVSTVRRRGEGLLNFVNKYSQLARVPKPDFQEISLPELFEHLKQLVQVRLEKAGVQLQFKLQKSSLKVEADRALIEQLLLNLLYNAIEAVSQVKDGMVEVEALQHKDLLMIRINDNGPGISPDLAGDIFLPFFTTKEDGSGIGLSLGRNIARAHNGRLYLDQEEKGTSFVLELPLKLKPASYSGTEETSV